VRTGRLLLAFFNLLTSFPCRPNQRLALAESHDARARTHIPMAAAHPDLLAGQQAAACAGGERCMQWCSGSASVAGPSRPSLGALVSGVDGKRAVAESYIRCKEWCSMWSMPR
jgi:hypothetical protein